METHKIYDYADRYVAGKLSEEERDFVDQQMSEEGDFARTFVTYLAANEAARRLADKQEKERLMVLFATDTESKNNPAKTLKLKPQIRRLLAAAVIVAACLVGYWLWNLPSQNSFEAAMEEVYEERIYKRTMLSAEGQFDRLFQEGKYAGALAVLKEEAPAVLPVNQAQNLERQGFCHWKLGDYQAAIETFEVLQESPILKPEKNPARYYLALTYWKMGKEEKSRALLEELSLSEGHFYQEKAKALLRLP